MKGLTKEKESCLWSYNHARYTSVYQAYAKPSETKVSIEEQIKKEMIELNGWDYRVCSRSVYSFTCGFRFRKDDGLEYLMFYKPSKWDIEIPLQEVDSETGEIWEREVYNYVW